MTATQKETLRIIDHLSRAEMARWQFDIINGTTHGFVAVRQLYDRLVIDRSMSDGGSLVCFERGPNWRLAEHISADIRNGHTR